MNRPAARSRDHEVVLQGAGLILVFVIFTTVCYVFAKALVSPTGDSALDKSLIATCIGGVTISCHVVWQLDRRREAASRMEQTATDGARYAGV